jgi:hypothetical protein
MTIPTLKTNRAGRKQPLLRSPRRCNFKALFGSAEPLMTVRDKHNRRAEEGTKLQAQRQSMANKGLKGLLRVSIPNLRLI